MVLNDTKDKCFYCERRFNVANYGTNKPCAKTRDHIIPVVSGGSNKPINMVYACTECNHWKAGNTLDGFVQLVKTAVEKNRPYKTIPESRFSLIIRKAVELKVYVEEKGDRLYRGSKELNVSDKLYGVEYVDKAATPKKKIKKPSPVGDYLKRHSKDTALSVNTNTTRKPLFTDADSRFIQCQTFEQFQLTKRHGATIARLLSEPEPNFHY